MPLRTSQCRRTLNDVLHRPTRSASMLSVPAPSSSSIFVWISDDVLNDTLSRFTKVTVPKLRCKRHGSHVPGPLEANRKLSRRRMAGHVVARQGQPGATPTVLTDMLSFGQQQQQQQQQRTGTRKTSWEPPASTSVRKKIESGMTFLAAIDIV